MKIYFCVLSFLALGCQSFRPQTSSSPPRITTGALERHIAYLADDALEGRDSGTEGGRKAEEYVIRELRGAGLDRVDTQTFEFVAAARLGTDSALAIAGRPVPAGEFQPYPFSQAAAGEWPAVFAGYGIAAPDLEHDDFKDLQVKGKVVVALAGSPDGDNPHGKFSPHQSARAKALKARELEAAALLLLAPALPRFEGNDVSSDVGIPVLAALAGSAGPLLGIDTAAGTGAPAEGRRGSRLLDRPVKLRADVTLERRSARNVLGWLRAKGPDAGNELVTELVIVGAHHDGLGRGGSSSLARNRQGEVHNGADDNASGVAGVIELARRLAPQAHRLRRSILFMTFGGEERGLLGSHHFAKHPQLEPFGPSARLRPVAMVNLDMVGRMRDQKLMLLGLATSEDWPALLETVQAKWKEAQGPALAISADKKEEMFGSSDHLSFYQDLNLPVLFFFTGAHQQYHTPDDDLYRPSASGGRELLINLEGASAALGFVEETVREIAMLESAPRYKPGIQLVAQMAFKVALRLTPDYNAEVEGMRIAQVTPGGPADRAGLRAGDVIVRFGSTPVKGVQDYMIGLGKARPGEEIEVTYLRDGKTQVARVTPASR